MNSLWKLLAAGALVALSFDTAVADDYKVQMKGGAGSQSVDFEPAFLKIAVGDTVTFVPNAPGHNVASIEAMAPDGTEPWISTVDQQLTVTFTTEGFYGYECPVHLAEAMVGLIQVGDARPSFDPDKAVAEMPEKARHYMKALLKKAGVAVAD